MGRDANLKWKIEVDTTPTTTATYAEVNGIESISWDNAEEVQEGYFISDAGYGYSDVTAGRLNISLTGKRISGDTAQDFIMGKMGKWGPDRKTTLKLTELISLETYTIPCSFEIASPAGGGAEELSEFEVVFHSDGAWTSSTIPADLVAPTVATVPLTGATGVATSASVVFTFSKAINPSDVTVGNFFLLKANVPVACGLTLGTNNTVVTMTPSVAMTSGVHIGFCTQDVRSASGVPLAAIKVTSFTV